MEPAVELVVERPARKVGKHHGVEPRQVREPAPERRLRPDALHLDLPVLERGGQRLAFHAAFGLDDEDAPGATDEDHRGTRVVLLHRVHGGIGRLEHHAEALSAGTVGHHRERHQVGTGLEFHRESQAVPGRIEVHRLVVLPEEQPAARGLLAADRNAQVDRLPLARTRRRAQRFHEHLACMLVLERHHVDGHARGLGKRRGVGQVAGRLVAVGEKEDARRGVARLRRKRHAHAGGEVGRLQVARVAGERDLAGVGRHRGNDGIARHRHGAHAIVRTLLARGRLAHRLLGPGAQRQRHAVACIGHHQHAHGIRLAHDARARHREGQEQQHDHTQRQPAPALPPAKHRHAAPRHPPERDGECQDGQRPGMFEGDVHAAQALTLPHRTRRWRGFGGL